jgi:hypothetical protein
MTVSPYPAVGQELPRSPGGFFVFYSRLFRIGGLHFPRAGVTVLKQLRTRDDSGRIRRRELRGRKLQY